MLRLAPSLAFVLLLPSQVPGATVVWKVSEDGNGHCYEFVPDEVHWPEAKKLAENRTPPNGFGKGHLVTISDAAENHFLATVFPKPKDIWIGFTDRGSEGEWRWIDDTFGIWQDSKVFSHPVRTAYANWCRGSPGSTTGKKPPSERNYAITNWAKWAGLWNDVPLDWGNPFIVEYEPLVYGPTFSTKTAQRAIAPIPSGTNSPIPAVKAQTAAMKRIQEALGENPSFAKLLSHANSIRTHATENPAVHYCLLEKAASTALTKRDYLTMMEATRRLRSSFNMPRDCGHKYLTAAFDKTDIRDYEDYAIIARCALEESHWLADPSTAELLLSTVELALQAARRSRDSDLRAFVETKLVDARAYAQRALAFREALEQLDSNPIDPHANLTVGKYLCNYQGKWDRAMTYLALGADPDIATAAKAELQLGQPTPEECLALARGWRNTVEKQPAFGERAAYWYRKAIAGLQGLQRISAERELARTTNQ